MSTASGVVGHPELQLVLSDTAPLGSAGSAVRACALSNGFEPERATRFQVVVEELIRESRMREAAPGTPGEVRVEVSFDGVTVAVTVVDHRLPLRAEQSRNLPSRRLLALGFADHLHVGFAGAAGNVATCRLTMAAAHPGDTVRAEMAEPDAPEPDAPESPGAQDGQVDVRLMTPADADGLVQCVFRCYGYTYPNPSMYQARAIRRQLESGSMISVVAVAPTGEVVGHVGCTFDRPGDVVPEAGKMIVDPRYRGHHLAERLSLARTQIAAERAIPGMWSECVTNHPASQRVAIERGAAEVGLLIGYSASDIAMVGLPHQDSVRHSLMAVFTPTGPLPTSTLTVPGYAADQVATLAGRLGVERQIRTESVQPTRARSRIHSAASALAGAMEIRVAEIGRDIADQVADVLEEYVAMAPAAVHLHLPATDSSAAWAAAELERIGFAWCAWTPAFLPTGDAIRLQRVSDHPVGLETIVCARAEGEAVRDFVVAEWTRVRRGKRG
jgi:RimJ/RimL family protein N-acetyltransferase/anti-sigma regulatory factor (Ser/Thr protein kinase)